MAIRWMRLIVGLVLVPSLAAAASVLVLNSGPGDYVGGGARKVLTPADGVFSASENYDNGVSVHFNGGAFESWDLDFSAPSNALLTATAYEGAQRFGFQSPTKPGMSITGEGNACNTDSGRFVVREVTYGAASDVTSFAADFEQHCEDGASVLYGTIVFQEGDATCAAAPDGTACDDLNACTGSDECLAGACAGTAVTDGTACDDGAAGTANDVCGAGACTGSFPTTTTTSDTSTTTTTSDTSTTTTTLPPPCHGDASRKIDHVLQALSSRLTALQKRMAQIERRAKVGDACRKEVDDAIQSLKDQVDSPEF
jgi:hypothetical protein